MEPEANNINSRRDQFKDSKSNGFTSNPVAPHGDGLGKRTTYMQNLVKELKIDSRFKDQELSKLIDLNNNNGMGNDIYKAKSLSKKFIHLDDMDIEKNKDLDKISKRNKADLKDLIQINDSLLEENRKNKENLKKAQQAYSKMDINNKENQKQMQENKKLIKRINISKSSLNDRLNQKVINIRERCDQQVEIEGKQLIYRYSFTSKKQVS